ncbi:hypothetical protein B0H16DRAFT_1735040 [Mycena metata]|uniref:Uncharacterized protein n=1 Tax=Mycena metata TaxID=1033252 RepID=A0AAD7HU33_9AGAR|nr:hypothetical protein B0H16DRAFT_1735040 [Mycena metata]
MVNALRRFVVRLRAHVLHRAQLAVRRTAVTRAQSLSVLPELARPLVPSFLFVGEAVTPSHPTSIHRSLSFHSLLFLYNPSSILGSYSPEHGSARPAKHLQGLACLCALVWALEQLQTLRTSWCDPDGSPGRGFLELRVYSHPPGEIHYGLDASVAHVIDVCMKACIFVGAPQALFSCIYLPMYLNSVLYIHPVIATFQLSIFIHLVPSTSY